MYENHRCETHYFSAVLVGDISPNRWTDPHPDKNHLFQQKKKKKKVIDYVI